MTISVNALKEESELQLRKMERRHEKGKSTGVGDEKVRRATKIYHSILGPMCLSRF